MNVGDVVEEKYEITRLIGEGGMGTVFEARHLRLGRKVALKFLRANLANSPEAASRFMREARAAATIGSEHVVDVMDVSQTVEGSPYLVMEYLEGEDLSRIIGREGPFAPARAALLTIQLCQALATAHSKGIIHRDVKPENMMIERRYDGTERLKVLDFGLVKFRLAAEGQTAKLTASGATLGTPYYMAPEQAMGEKDLDHRVDVYSAGVVLFQMLTKAMPFDGETYAEILVKAATRPPLRPREVRPELTPDLEAIVLRAIAREPTQRFQSAVELAQAITPYTAGTAPAVMGMAPTMLPRTAPPSSTAPGLGGVPLPPAVLQYPVGPHFPSGPDQLSPSGGGSYPVVNQGVPQVAPNARFTPAGYGEAPSGSGLTPAFAPTISADVPQTAAGYAFLSNPMQTAPPVMLAPAKPSRGLRVAGLVLVALLFVAITSVATWFALGLDDGGERVAAHAGGGQGGASTSSAQIGPDTNQPEAPAQVGATATPLEVSAVEPGSEPSALPAAAPDASPVSSEGDDERPSPRDRRRTERPEEPAPAPAQPAAPAQPEAPLTFPPTPAQPARPAELPFPTPPAQPAPQPTPRPAQVLTPQPVPTPPPAPVPAPPSPNAFSQARARAQARDWSGCIRELNGVNSGDAAALRVRCYHGAGNAAGACAAAAQCSSRYCRRYLREVCR